MSSRTPAQKLIFECGTIAPFNSSSLLEPDKITLRQKEKSTNEIGNNVKVIDISITTIGGERISLLGFYNTLYVDESISTASIAGKITFADSEGAFEKFAIRGGEKLSIRIENSVSSKIIIFREDLIVDKIEANEFDVLTLNNTYLMHFSSRSFVTSLKKNIFKSYTGSLAESVYSLYREMSVNDLFIEDPKITIPATKPYICTGENPHKALMHLASRASNNNRVFAFFERFIPIYGNYSDSKSFTSTHYFGSIQKLIDDAKVNGAPSIYFNPKVDARFENIAIRAVNFRPLSNYTHIPATHLGLYSSELTFINPFTRKVVNQNMSYISDSVNDFYDNKLVDRQNAFSVNTQQKQKRVSVSSINEFTSKESWLRNKILLTLTNNLYKISVDIQGSTNEISVGHVVNFVFPSRVDKVLNPEQSVLNADPIISGRYLVHAVKHYISGNSYVKTLILGRGSSPYNIESGTISDPTYLEFLRLANDKLKV
jgi:hypothetical protein